MKYALRNRITLVWGLTLEETAVVLKKESTDVIKNSW
jgi:hypothetical protein